MTLLYLLESFFQPQTSVYKFGNVPYDYNDETKESTIKIHILDEIRSNRSINSEKNKEYLQAILSRRLFEYFCLPGSKAKQNNHITDQTQWAKTRANRIRSKFVTGGFLENDSKKPDSLMKSIVNSQNNGLLEEQIDRIRSLIRVTAGLKVCGICQNKTDYYLPKNFDSNTTRIFSETIANIKRELAVSFDQNCQAIKECLQIDTVYKEIIEVYIASAIVYIVFDNKEYFEKNKDSDSLLKNRGRIKEIIRNYLMNAIAKFRESCIPFVLKESFFDNCSFYIEREEELNNLVNSAYETYNIHAICGERGLGKSLFAIHVAKKLKQEKNTKVVWCTYQDSIKKTVASLKRKNESEIRGMSIEERFKLNVSGLNEDILLVVDNYENREYNRELTHECPEYASLLESKVKILLTSTQTELAENNQLRGHVTNLSKLETEDLKKIFYSISGHSNNGEDDVKRLIEKYINWNTYLVVLCGELGKDGMTAKEIIEIFESLRSDKTHAIQASTASEREKKYRTLMRHFCGVLDSNKIVNPDDLEEQKAVHRILFILALFPIGGIGESYFNALCGELTDRDKNIIKQLKSRHIIYSDGKKIWLQPVIMEYIFRSIFIFNDDVLNILQILKNKLGAEMLNDELWNWMEWSDLIVRKIWDTQLQEDENGNDAKERTRKYFSNLREKVDQLKKYRSSDNQYKRQLKDTIKYLKNQIADVFNQVEKSSIKTQLRSVLKTIDQLQSQMRDTNTMIESQGKKATALLKAMGTRDADVLIKKVIFLSCVVKLRLAACYSGVDLFEDGEHHISCMQNMLKEQMNYDMAENITAIIREEAKKTEKRGKSDTEKTNKINSYSELEKATTANCCVTISYTLLNLNRKEEAQKYIDFGLKLLAEIDIKENKGDIYSQVVLTTLNGMNAGKFLNQASYQEALVHHTAVLEERERLKERMKAESSEYRDMIIKISLMHRGIGTDHFYLARKVQSREKKIDHLIKSYNSHKKTIEIYNDFKKETIGTIGNYNRFAGTALELASMLNEDELEKAIKQKYKPLMDEIYSYMKEAFEIYSESVLNRNSEVRASLERLITLSEMLGVKGLDKKKANINLTAIQVVNKLQESPRTADNECQALANKLYELTPDPQGYSCG